MSQQVVSHHGHGEGLGLLVSKKMAHFMQSQLLNSDMVTSPIQFSNQIYGCFISIPINVAFVGGEKLTKGIPPPDVGPPCLCTRPEVFWQGAFWRSGGPWEIPILCRWMCYRHMRFLGVPHVFTKTIRYEKHRKNCLLYFGDPVPKIGECSSRLLQSAWNKFGYPQKSIRRDQTKCVDCECLRHSQFFTDFAPSKFRGHGMSWLISCQSVTIYMNSWYKSNYPTNRFPICLIVYSPCYQWSKPHSNPLWMKPSKTQCFMD